MKHKVAVAFLAAFVLTGCSYGYDLRAVVVDGRLAFVVDANSNNKPTCLREIWVQADDERGPTWRETVSYDEVCANGFPQIYGQRLKGTHQSGVEDVNPKPLRREVEYVVHTTSGATGYGEARFTIHADGKIENLPKNSAEPMLENAM